MPSTQSKLFHALLRIIAKKSYLRRQLASGRASRFDCPQPTPKVKKVCHVYNFRVNGRNVFQLTPKNKSRGTVHILYLHGGAYIQCFNRFHWAFLADLVTRTGCTITAVDYPLAPASTYRDTFEMAIAVYRRILATTKAEEIILMGDSSGGGLALALAKLVREENEPQPGRIILLSPWLDIRLTNPDINALEAGDPFLEKESLQQAGRLYAGNTDPAHYLLSPINGTLNKLGKLSIFTGSKEILVADARKLKALAELHKIDIDYYEYEDMVHGWMFLNFPESKKARQQINHLVQSPVE